MDVNARHKPVGADLLRLFGPWAAGVQLSAGGCLLSHEPASTRLLGRPCCHPGCQSLICGSTEDELLRRMVDHRQRCHSGPLTVKQKEIRS